MVPLGSTGVLPFSSRTVYLMTVEGEKGQPEYKGRSLKAYCQPSLAVTVFVSTSVPLASRPTWMLAGRLEALSPSFQYFWPLTEVCS